MKKREEMQKTRKQYENLEIKEEDLNISKEILNVHFKDLVSTFNNRKNGVSLSKIYLTRRI
jgi:hypothetical protein